jgi:hypothetical protein
MRLYPDLPRRRAAALGGDAAVVVLLLLLAWLGVKVHDTVDELASLGRGMQSAGGAVQSGFDSAADAVGGTPVVGGDLADALREGGEGSGGEVREAGARGEDAVHDTATLLGVLTFAIPALTLLSRTLPARIAQVRGLTAASRALDGAAHHRREVAQRAAFSLPYGALLRHTHDPLGDLAAGRYDALVRAAFEEAGLRAPPTAPGTSPGSPS